MTQPVMFTHQKLLKHLYKDNVTDIVFFTLDKIYFLLVLSKRWIRREIINTLKKGITSAMEFADVAAFTFAM